MPQEIIVCEKCHQNHLVGSAIQLEHSRSAQSSVAARNVSAQQSTVALKPLRSYVTQTERAFEQLRGDVPIGWHVKSMKPGQSALVIFNEHPRNFEHGVTPVEYLHTAYLRNDPEGPHIVIESERGNYDPATDEYTANVQNSEITLSLESGAIDSDTLYQVFELTDDGDLALYDKDRSISSDELAALDFTITRW